MRIAIVGGGFTGLTAAYELTRLGHNVCLFERDNHLGGLAYGFRSHNWDWYLEGAYHHLFTNDHAIMHLCKELNVPLIIKHPITANLTPNSKLSFESRRGVRIARIDSPLDLLRFPLLSPWDKLRTGILAAFCKFFPFWQPLEKFTAKQFALAVGGRASWRTIWEPLMIGKFGELSDTVAASWLWARIHKRTPSLAYIEGGFQTLVLALESAIKKQGGKIYTNSELKTLNSEFDRTLLTVPTPIAEKLLGVKLSASIPHLHAQVLILETTKPILKDTYWLSITDRSYPFLAVVQHTNFMDKKHYGGHHLTYIGNYLPQDHPYLTMTKEQLLKKFMTYIKKLNPTIDLRSMTSYLFVGPFAQPVHQVNYSKKAPKFETPIPGVYLANMDSIYPWDRGTNYAVELGQKAAQKIHENS